MRALSVAVIALAVAPAAVAAPKSGLVLKKVSKPPKTVAAGDDFLVRSKVKNVGERAKGGRVTIRLVRGTGDYALPRRIGRFKTGRIAPGSFRRFTVRLTVPGDQGAGRYRLQTCVNAKRQPQSCRVSRRLRVTG